MPPASAPEPPVRDTGARRRLRVWLLRAGLAAVALLLAGAAAFLWVAAPMLTGFVAKGVCSGVFVQGRDADAVAAEDLGAYSTAALFALVSREVDAQARAVRTHLGPAGRALAVHRPGLGCTLAPDGPPVAMPGAGPVPSAGAAPPAWPDDAGAVAPEAPEASIAAALQAAVDAAFAEDGDGTRRGTRAVVIVHRGRIIAERYAPGFGPDTPLPGWSMAKSVTAVLVGRAVAEGRLDPDAPLPVDAWPAGDPRRAIRWRDALAMSDGLAFSENYASPLSDATQMLFVRPGAGEYAAGRPLAHAPGTRWAYSSGTTNLVSLALARVLGDDYAAWPRTRLFEPLGMASAVFEPDARGVFVGSSFLYATARDWARFGLFVLRDGHWQGRRLLPEGWVQSMRSPGPATDRYGAHWWRVEPAAGQTAALPPGAFQATGHAGQRLTIVPSHDLVVVRLGQTLDTRRLRHLDLLTAAMDAVGPAPGGDPIR